MTFVKPSTTEGILERLQNQYPRLSPQLRQAAQYVLDHPNDIGVSSMRQIAEAAEVKPNTLVRMARSMGFQGYEEFREPFQAKLRDGINSFPDQARWLQSLAQGASHGKLYSRMAASALRNIEQLFSEVSIDEIKIVADRIDASRRTFVYGVGICAAIAQNFWYVGRMAMENLELVPRRGNLPIDDIAKIGGQDVLLTMTFSPYRTEVVEITRLAKQRNACLVSITDSRASPIALNADHVFVAPTETPQMFTSMVAVTAFLETLLAFMIADADEQVVANIQEFHRLRSETGVYWSEK